MSTLTTSIAQFIADAALAHSIINGDATTIVTTANGPVRSFAKLESDMAAYFSVAQANSTSATASALAASISAAIATAASKIFPTIAAALGNGIVSTTGFAAGTGGTNGTFALAFSGGTQVIPPSGYFVVAGGIVTQMVMRNGGYYSAGTPAISFAASAGLTGAVATAVMGANVPVGQYFGIPATGGSFNVYQVAAGPVANFVAKASGAIEAAVFPPSANLLNPNTTLANTSLTVSTGTTTSTSGWTCSDFFPVVGGGSIAFAQGATPLLTTAQIVFYDAGQNYLSGSVVSNAVAPANAAYARVASTTVNSATAQIVAGTTAPASFTAYGRVLTTNDTNYPLTIPEAAIAPALRVAGADLAIGLSFQSAFLAPAQTTFLLAGLNLLNFNDPNVVLGSDIQGSTGTVNVLSGWNASGYIPVTAGQSYATTVSAPVPQGTNATNGAWYDVNKNYLSGLTFTGVGGITVAPAGAAYMRVSIQTTTWPTFMVQHSTTIPILYVPYGYALNSANVIVKDPRVDSLVLPWEGKSLIILGDSFATQGLWIPSFCVTTGMRPDNIVNLGVVGQVLATMASAVTGAMLDAADLVLVQGGTNNYGHGGTTLGAAADAIGANTIYGSAFTIVDTVLTLRPTKRMVYFSQPMRGTYSGAPTEPTPPAVNPYGLTIDLVMDNACLAFAERGIPGLNLLRTSGCSTYNLGNFLQDGLHPNAGFAVTLGRLMGQFVNEYV